MARGFDVDDGASSSNVSTVSGQFWTPGLRTQFKGCPPEDSVRSSEVFVRDVNDFTSPLEIFRDFVGGALSDAFRQSALAVLGITPDYPETFTNFDFSVAIPQSYRECAPEEDLETLKTKLLHTAKTYQMHCRAAEITRIATIKYSEEGLKNMDKDGLMTVLGNELKNANYKSAVPGPYYVISKFFPAALENSKLLSGFSTMNHIYKDGNYWGKLTEAYKLAVFEILKVTTSNPPTLDDEELKPAIPSFILNKPTEYQTLKKKLVHTIRNQQNSLRVKEVLDWALSKIADAKKAGEVVAKRNINKLLQEGIDIFEKPNCTISLSLLQRSFRRVLNKYLEEQGLDTDFTDSTQDAEEAEEEISKAANRSHYAIRLRSADTSPTSTKPGLVESSAQWAGTAVSKKRRSTDSPRPTPSKRGADVSPLPVNSNFLSGELKPSPADINSHSGDSNFSLGTKDEHDTVPVLSPVAKGRGDADPCPLSTINNDHSEDPSLLSEMGNGLRAGPSLPLVARSTGSAGSSMSTVKEGGRSTGSGQRTMIVQHRASPYETTRLNSTATLKSNGADKTPLLNEAAGVCAGQAGPINREKDLNQKVLDQLSSATEEERLTMFRQVRREVNQRLTEKIFELTSTLDAAEQSEIIRKIFLEKCY